MCIRDSKGVCRRSGEPYICHPLAVARLVLDLGMDSESIAAALLHDVVEDTPTTLTDLTAAFGEEVAALVDGVTKLTKIQFSNIEELQAENLRKMLLALSLIHIYKVVKVTDYKKPEETGLPAANVLIYSLDNGATVVVRPSGTEPKIKTYFTTLGKDLAEAQAQKDALAAAIEPILA